MADRIIAIMLGRLHMSVEECIAAYVELSNNVFQKKHYLPVHINGKLKARFDSTELEKAVRSTVKTQDPGGTEEALLKDPNGSQSQCKV